MVALLQENKNDIFLKLYSKIRRVAINFYKEFHCRFDIDELISEAWIQFQNENLSCAEEHILKRVKWDMLSYIRHEMGRDIFIAGEKIPRPKFITNQGDKSGRNILNTDISSIDNQDLVQFLLSCGLTKIEKEAILLYYFNDMKMKEIGYLIGKSETFVSTVIHRGIRKCSRKWIEMENNHENISI